MLDFVQSAIFPQTPLRQEYSATLESPASNTLTKARAALAKVRAITSSLTIH